MNNEKIFPKLKNIKSVSDGDETFSDIAGNRLNKYLESELQNIRSLVLKSSDILSGEVAKKFGVFKVVEALVIHYAEKFGGKPSRNSVLKEIRKSLPEVSSGLS